MGPVNCLYLESSLGTAGHVLSLPALLTRCSCMEYPQLLGTDLFDTRILLSSLHRSCAVPASLQHVNLDDDCNNGYTLQKD